MKKTVYFTGKDKHYPFIIINCTATIREGRRPVLRINDGYIARNLNRFNMEKLMREIIRADFNHPSVIKVVTK